MTRLVNNRIVRIAATLHNITRPMAIAHKMAITKRQWPSRPQTIRQSKRRMQTSLLKVLTSTCMHCTKRSFFQYLHQRKTFLAHLRMAVTRSQTRKLPAKKTPNEGQTRPELQARKPKQSSPEPPIARPLQTTTTPTMPSNMLPKPDIAAGPQQVSRQDEKMTRITEKAPAVRPESSGKKRAATDGDKSGNRVAKKSPRTAAPTISGAWPSSLGNPRRRGLQNPANWCYRRSVLQSLFSTPQFFNVLANHEPGTCPRNCVTCGLRTALRTYHSNSPQLGGHIRQLDERIHATGRKSDPRWTANGHTQEDAHDFLTYLLGTVEGVKGTT